jgi:hypothetical protein
MEVTDNHHGHNSTSLGSLKQSSPTQSREETIMLKAIVVSIAVVVPAPSFAQQVRVITGDIEHVYGPGGEFLDDAKLRAKNRVERQMQEQRAKADQNSRQTRQGSRNIESWWSEDTHQKPPRSAWSDPNNQQSPESACEHAHNRQQSPRSQWADPNNQQPSKS